MDPNSLGEALSPNAWVTDAVFSVAALLVFYVESVGWSLS